MSVADRLREELPGIYPALLARAVKIARNSSLAGGNPATTKQAARDLLHQSVLDTAEEDRKWNPDEVPLYVFLVGVMRSKASNHNTNEKRKATVHGVDLSEMPAGSNPLISYMSAEACAEIEEVAFEAALEDPVLEKIVEELMDNNRKPREIAEATGMDVKDVANAVRKLRRRIEKKRSEA